MYLGRLFYVHQAALTGSSLPGADRTAIRTGAIVIANGEAINCLRNAGVPEKQLVPVAGGERVPLFKRQDRLNALSGDIECAPGPPGAPAMPAHIYAALSVHVWPSLHCLMPGKSHADVPEVMDTGVKYTGEASQYQCTLDITFGMKYGLLRVGQHMPRETMAQGMQSFVEYVEDKRNAMSYYDGGQLMYNFLIGDKALLWSAHLGGYRGILESIQPKPNVLVQAIAGRANLNGRPFDGSAAEFAVKTSQWLGEPEKVIWCLHDDSPIKPLRVNTTPATDLVQQETRSRVIDLQPTEVYALFS
ncbi:hypothetical protein C1H76_7431 [Elsinoe australis]|uniref:Uncharacterized protein n=1 Tax=Elsinoe australis TaxID=40998 RepID=A0A4U7ATI5_9PEZI|nr:hypothetical protein C1H76_7431 [Elsinoe australis]